MSSLYDPRFWFWVVGGDGRVWSGRAVAYVETDSAEFSAWQAAGNTPTRIASEAELVDVLRAYAATVSPSPDPNLTAQISELGV